MRRLLPILALSLVLGVGSAGAAPRLAPEERMARALEGRTAGAPVDCIWLRNVRSSQVIDKTAILYDAGGTIYVNRPKNGAESLDRHDTLLTKTHSSQLCSIDVVELYDAGSRTFRGVVFLGAFTPYRKPNLRD